MARGDNKDLDPRDKPYARGPLGLDPKAMKELRQEAELYKNAMLESSEYMKSQLDFMSELKREAGIRSQAVNDYLSDARSISRELTEQSDFLDKINDGEIQLSEAKKVQEKAQKRVNRLKDNAKTAQETLLKLEKDGVITKEAAGKAQDSIMDGLAEADTFQQKINDGVNRAAKGSNLFTKNIGGLSKFMKKAGFDNASKHMSNMAKGVSKAKIAGGGFAKQIVAAGRAAKLNPYILIATALTGLVKMLLELNNETAKLGRELGVSAAEAASIRNHFIDSAAAVGMLGVEYRDVMKQNSAFNQALGTASVLAKEIVGDAAVLAERFKLSQEAVTQTMIVATALGKTVNKVNSENLRGVRNAENELGFRVDIKRMMDETAKITGTLRAQFAGNLQLLGESVTKASALGMSLGEVANQSRKILDFQSSIDAELQAELFLGKQLNLEKARLAALTNDYDTYMNEIVKNAGDFFSFSRLNRLEQEKLAVALNMSTDQLSDMLLKRESLKSLTEAARKETDEQLKAQFMQLSAQEAFNKTMEKLKFLVINLVARLESFLQNSGVARFFGLDESLLQFNPGGDEPGTETSSGRAITGRPRIINAEDFTIKTHPKDTLVMAGGTQLGNDDALKRGFEELKRAYGQTMFQGNISYSGFDAVKAPTNYGTKFDS